MVRAGIGGAEVLQANLTHRGGFLQNVILPLYFVDRDVPTLSESVWALHVDRGQFFRRQKDGNPVDWATRQIIRFLIREQNTRGDLIKLARKDDRLSDSLQQTVGLRQRVARTDPPDMSIPPEDEVLQNWCG